VQPPTPAWGNMLGEGLAINLMSNALRDWLDPHMKV
jgi:hypothetical protein